MSLKWLIEAVSQQVREGRKGCTLWTERTRVSNVDHN